MDSHYLTAEQVAQELGVGIRKARRICEESGGRKVTKGWLTTRAALDAWVVKPCRDSCMSKD